MNILTRILAFAASASIIGTPAFGYTLSGTIPSSPHPVVIDLHMPLERGNITFTFSAPAVNAGVRYELGYCIGPKNNPCGSTLSRQVSVPAGETRTLTTDALVFTCNELVVGQGTAVPVPYSVEVTQP